MNCLLCQSPLANGRGKYSRLCRECWTPARAKELSRVDAHCERAKRHGLPATLTLAEWLETIEDFQGKCAYCLKVPFTVLDHFIPLGCGISPLITIRKGTSKDNCVPACKACNIEKWAASPEYLLKWHPERLDPPTKRRIRRIQKYLKLSF